METQLLRDPDLFPTKKVLKDALGESYDVLQELITTITSHELGLTLE